MVNGEIEIARIIEPNVPDVQGAEGVEIIATPKAGSTRMYLMNTAKAPTDDINVRRAINMAIDKEAMLQLPGCRLATPGNRAAAVQHGAQRRSLHAHGVRHPLRSGGANALLDENGWALNGDIREKDGVQLVLDMVTTQNDVDAGQIEPIDGFLNEIGARLNIRAGDFNFWIDTVQETDFHMTLMSDSGYIGVGIIEEFFRKASHSPIMAWPIPELNELIDAAVRGADTRGAVGKPHPRHGDHHAGGGGGDGLGAGLPRRGVLPDRWPCLQRSRVPLVLWQPTERVTPRAETPRKVSSLPPVSPE